MKALGFVLLAALLVGGGVALVLTGVWTDFVNWVSTLAK